MTSGDPYDAIVVGGGPNGLCAANVLVDAGWRVLLLEAQEEVGGAVRSDCEVHPDFVHDTFSSFYPLAAASPVIRGLRLEEYGVEWCHAPAVMGHVMGDGSWSLLHRDREVTARLADERHRGDGEAWLKLCRQWDVIGDSLVGGFLRPFPPVSRVPGVLTGLWRTGGLGMVRTLLTPAAELVADRFRDEALMALMAGNAGHADIPLEAPGSGLMGLLLTMLGQTVGFPVPRGGAGALSQAMARRYVDRGGEIRTGVPVERIGLSGGRAGLVHGGGSTWRASRAVIAGVTAVQLYGAERPVRRPGLLAEDDVPTRTRRRMESFTLDPSTIKVDWALDGPAPWAEQPAYAPGTVHVADGMADLTHGLAKVAAGVVPENPFLLAGQMTTTDSTRSPAGTESFWAYTHVPQRVRDDAGPDGLTGAWDHDECERMADRIESRIEKRAPGFGSRVRARRVLGPRELEQRDANLVGGAINGGTAQLHQQLVFRPVAGLGRAETGVPGLYLGSASAHPGGAVHGAAGANAARAAMAHHRWRRLVPRRA